MMPNLMSLHELTSGSVLGKCYGFLDPIRNDVVTEVLNGKYELSFQYPLKGALIASVQVGRVVYAGIGNGDQDYFLIYRISKVINGWVTVYSRHISCLLHRYVCLPFTANTVEEAVTEMMKKTVDGSVFTLSVDDAGHDLNLNDYPMTVVVPTQLGTLMGSEKGCIRDVFGGEWLCRKFTAQLTQSRGQNRGMQIRYGFNMTDLQADYDAHAVPDGYYAYIREDSPVGFHSVVATRFGYARQKGAWLEAKDYTEEIQDYFSEKAQDPFFPEEFTEADWLAELEARAEIDIETLGEDLSNQGGRSTQCWLPSFRVGFEMLKKTKEYKDTVLPDVIELGDLVKVTFGDADVHETMRVTEIQYCPTADKYKSIVVGPPRRSIIKTILKK